MIHTCDVFAIGTNGEDSLKLSEAFAGDIEVSKFTSLSADWAGGGIISTGSDLIKFQHALFSGEAYFEKNTGNNAKLGARNTRNGIWFWFA